jgi:acylaminoacyl-peptidase
VLNVWLAPADDVAAAAPLTRLKGRPLQWQDWSADGQHVLFANDRNGDENWHIFAVHRATGVIRDLTPFDRANAQALLRCSKRT